MCCSSSSSENIHITTAITIYLRFNCDIYISTRYVMYRIQHFPMTIVIIIRYTEKKKKILFVEMCAKLPTHIHK